MTNPTTGRVTSFMAGAAAVVAGVLALPRILDAAHDFLAEALADGFGRAEQNAIENGLDAMEEAAASMNGGQPSVLSSERFADRVQNGAAD